MRATLLLSAWLLCAPALAGCLGAPDPSGSDGCRYSWNYGGARVVDVYAAPPLDNATSLLDGTTLRDVHDVTGPDFIRKADHPDEEGDHWRWRFPAAFAMPGYFGTLQAYVDAENGSLTRVRVVHEWLVHGGEDATGLTWGSVEDAKRAREPAYREDLARLAPEVERVRAALAPRLGEAPSGTDEEMGWTAHAVACV